MLEMPPMRVRPIAALLPLLTLFSCSQYEPFDSASHVRETYAERLPADLARQVQPPYELDEDLVRGGRTAWRF